MNQGNAEHREGKAHRWTGWPPGSSGVSLLEKVDTTKAAERLAVAVLVTP